VLINVDKDASRESDKNEIELNNVDVLSFGSDSHSLVSSIDLLYRNSWGEVFVKHYDGDSGFIDFLEDILNTRHPHENDFNNVNFDVHCFSYYLSGVIRQQIYDFILDAVSVINDEELDKNYKVFMLGGKSYTIIDNHKQVSIVPLNNTLEFFHVLENSQIEQQRQLENSPYIEIIYQFASFDILQFFFEDLKDGFRVYLLDENNKLMSFIYLKLSKESFVAQINKKVADSNEDERGSSAKFGLPQFYQLNNENGEISVSTYS
jgi:adenylate cyclase class 1